MTDTKFLLIASIYQSRVNMKGTISAFNGHKLPLTAVIQSLE